MSLTTKMEADIDKTLIRYTLFRRDNDNDKKSRDNVIAKIKNVMTTPVTTIPESKVDFVSDDFAKFAVIDAAFINNPTARNFLWHEIASILCGYYAFVEYTEPPRSVEQRYKIGTSSQNIKYIVTLKTQHRGNGFSTQHKWYMFKYGDPMTDQKIGIHSTIDDYDSGNDSAEEENRHEPTVYGAAQHYPHEAEHRIAALLKGFPKDAFAESAEPEERPPRAYAGDYGSNYEVPEYDEAVASTPETSNALPSNQEHILDMLEVLHKRVRELERSLTNR